MSFGALSGARADAVTRGFAISPVTCASVLLPDRLLKLFFVLVTTVPSNLVASQRSPWSARSNCALLGDLRIVAPQVCSR